MNLMGFGAKEFFGSGLKFPLGIDPRTGKIEMVSGEEDIKESVGILIKTYVGERVMRADYGARTQDIVFSITGDYLGNSSRQELQDAILIHEPRVHAVEVQIKEDSGREGMLLVEIGYRVRSTNNYFNMVYPFYTTEGAEA
jgi:phage baseplate assembly protein W